MWINDCGRLINKSKDADVIVIARKRTAFLKNLGVDQDINYQNVSFTKKLADINLVARQFASNMYLK